MQLAPSLLAGALVIGVAGGVALRETPPVQQAAPQAQDWKPRNTISRDVGMSAEDLDNQQPDAVAFHATRPVNRRAVAYAVSGATPGGAYRNCREARAAGATPLYRGQPGYGAHMDGDNDGIACEPVR